MMTFAEEYKLLQSLIEDALPGYFWESKGAPDKTSEAALYSLMAGGKRFRPVLLLAVGKVLGVPINELMPYACAVEMIHTYSLVHDDLPCMDNDTLRRGQPTCHVKYSEAIALLAGDALLNRAYHLLFNECARHGEEKYIIAAMYLAKMAGYDGMIGGQTMDILSEGIPLDNDTLRLLQRKKTGALLQAAALIPVVLSERDELSEKFAEYSGHLGLAFQIKDDILDAASTGEKMGKTAGKDAKAEKATHVSLYGIGRAEMILEGEFRAAHKALLNLGGKGLDVQFLMGLNQYLLTREN